MLVQYHRSITRTALENRFSPRALDAILAANLKQDNLLTGQIGHDEYHYDNNAIAKSHLYLEEQRALIRSAIQVEDVSVAWAAFGRLIHTAQDFYAHTNYVDLWLAHFSKDGQTPPPPPEIAPLMEEVVHSPNLRSGVLYYPIEVLAFIPGIKHFVIPLLPKDSHAHMHIDSPARGERFDYAFEAAIRRTRYEFDKTVAGLSSGHEALFTDLVKEERMIPKKLILALSILALAVLSCRMFIPGTPTSEPPSASDALETPEPSPVDMQAKLDELGGEPCAENPDFTCVSIPVSLDHFNGTNSETLEVVFAVAPATGERYGMFVQAFPGGPGGEGVSTGGLFWFPDAILEHYDIVFFDQRGVGLSHPLACPTAYARDFLNFLNHTNEAGLEGYDTPEEQQTSIDDAHTFVEECVAEIGPEATRLEYFGTDQVAEDIETFRQVIGDEKFMLYGVSYGTAVAQIYAAAHPDHLMGLVLDGTSDLTLTGEEGSHSQEMGFDTVLVATLKACDVDETCAADLGGDALAVYDELAQQISEDPARYEFPLPSGEKVARTFTFNQLEFTTAYQMYSLTGRMLFLRALAAAREDDMAPMARLLYQQALLDPESFEYMGDPTFSDTMFYSVHCTDDSYFGGTPEERIQQTIEAGQASNGTVPRLDGSVYTGLYCAYWPSSPADVVMTQPLVAEGVPTFVLNATLDPATPFAEGKAVFEHLADGYHLYVNGGRHSIFGWGYDCPDSYITDFMVDGTLPSQREIVCEDWGEAVISAYEPRILENASDYPDPLDIFWAIDGEVQLQPEYYYSRFEEDTAVACPYGGSFTFGPRVGGAAFTFEDCAYTQGFALTGDGNYDYGAGRFTIDAEVSGDKSGTLTYVRDNNSGSISVTGEYGGETIDLQD